jgi:PAS domain S-box-containing protein
VTRTGKPLLADRKTIDRLIHQKKFNLIGQKALSWLGAPLKLAGEVIGVVAVQSYRTPDAYTQQDLELLSALSSTIARSIRHKQAEEHLRESERQYRTLLNSIQDGVFMIIGRQFYAINDAFAQMSGHPAYQLERKHPADLFSGEITNLLSTDSPPERAETLPRIEQETLIKQADGGRLEVMLNAAFFSYQAHTACIGTIKDISRKRIMEAEKRRLEEKLIQSEKMEAIGRLAGTVAHDLNNVLSAIVGYPDLILRQLGADSPLIRHVGAIKKSGLKASAIVEDLLTLSRRGVQKREVFNLGSLIRDYIESADYNTLISEHPEIRVTVSLTDTPMFITGSALHLTKAVMNLVNNAIEAMPCGGDIQITTQPLYFKSIDPEGLRDYAVLKISDAGIGIPPSDQKRIFEPFFTRKQMGRSGSGLGMSIVWNTVKDHEGYISLDSTLGKGTVFEIYLPMQTDGVETLGRTVEEKGTGLPVSEGSGQRILVVDDGNDQREVACQLLNRLGYEAIALASGEAALQYLSNHPVDMLMLDMLMEPGIDGLETFRRAKALKGLIPTIIASACPRTGKIVDALEEGARAYLKKPYTMEQLAQTVSDVLNAKSHES